jgi:hypothetical protein
MNEWIKIIYIFLIKLIFYFIKIEYIKNNLNIIFLAIYTLIIFIPNIFAIDIYIYSHFMGVWKKYLLLVIYFKEKYLCS